jgi:hypothetical protein
MSAHDSSLDSRRTGVDWGRAEFLLVLFGFLGFLTLPIRLTTIYSGLPAHPLFLHVPVMLVPITVIAAIVLMVRPDWLERYGIATAIVSVIAMGSIFITMQAGGALQSALDLHGEAARLVSEHSEAAKILAILYVLFTATVIVAFATRRISQGRPTGLAIVDRLLSPPAVFTALRILVVVLAIGSVVMVARTGDLGAKAVWQGKLEKGNH